MSYKFWGLCLLLSCLAWGGDDEAFVTFSLDGLSQPGGGARIGGVFRAGEGFALGIGSGFAFDTWKGRDGRRYYDASPLVPLGIGAAGLGLYAWMDANEGPSASAREGGMAVGVLAMIVAPFVLIPMAVQDLEIYEGTPYLGLYQRHQLDYMVPDSHWREKQSAGLYVNTAVSLEEDGDAAGRIGVRLGVYRSLSKSSVLRGKGLEASISWMWL